MASTFEGTLVTPQSHMLDAGELIYAYVPAHDGMIGIAPMRASLLLELGQGPMRLDYQEGGSRWFYVEGGFAQMKDNALTLLADHAVPAEDIVRREAAERLETARQQNPSSGEKYEQRQRELDRARRMTQLADLVSESGL
jgi:F-type H+-transporting ATPase subunit epsilon